MDNTLERARGIATRFGQLTWGDLVYLSPREEHAVMAALRMSAIMPDGKDRCLTIQCFLLLNDDRSDYGPDDEGMQKYIRQFLQLVAGFMGCYEESGRKR